MDPEVRFQTGGRLVEVVESVVELRAMGEVVVIVRFRVVEIEMIWFPITPASVGFGTDNDDMESEDVEMVDVGVD